MVRTSLAIPCALAAASVAQAEVSSSWSSFSWSSAAGATFEKHDVVRSDDGQMQMQVERLTSADVMAWISNVFEQSLQTLAHNEAKVVEDVQLAEEGPGHLQVKKENVRCAGSWCQETVSIVDTTGLGQPLHETPLVATGWRIPSAAQRAYRAPGLRGASAPKRVHVPCHHGQPKAHVATGGFELKDSMTLIVDDPEAFVADKRSSQAVAAAIAQQFGVDPKDVHVTLSVGAGPAPAMKPAMKFPSVVSPTAVETEGAGSPLLKLAPFAAALLSTLFLSAACLAPAMRRHRKRATWERQLHAGSRLEALYKGEWFPGVLSSGQKSPEGYWVVQCDVDVDGQLLYSMDIRPEGAASVAASEATPNNDLGVGLLPAAVKTQVLAEHGKSDQVAEKLVVRAYIARLFEREAAADEMRAVRAYSSRIVARALMA